MSGIEATMQIVARLVLGAVGAVSSVAALADAPSLFQSHFASVAGGEPCYARSYSAEHLKAHPEQRVTDIEVDMAKTNPDGKPITEDSIELGFGIKVRGKPDWYTNVAICKSAKDLMECFLEGDGGRFTLAAADTGLKLSNGDWGIAIEGAEDFVEIPGDKGDDRVFLLNPADAPVCAAAGADAAAPN